VLGHPFVLRGVVGHGDARGESLGTPRQSRAGAHQALPREGVYAGATRLDGSWWPAGDLGGNASAVLRRRCAPRQVYVPGFEGDLYDLDLEVTFLARCENR